MAIIGVGLRLPQSDRLDQFWRHLEAGESLISRVSPRRWDAEALQGNPAKGNHTRSVWGGFLEDADCFDAAFFKISPREASWMDPQQRFALEMAWHAIEDAGLRASALAGSRTGVYMGVCHWDYAELLEKHLAHVDAYTPTGIAFSIIANRISHFFDFQGPSITNDTACASSMTSVYEAVRALQSGECDQALAGGVNLIWSPNHFVSFSKAGMLSATGESRAFDDGANGYVRGEGGAVLLLKPLSRAMADGDTIKGIIRGIGVNHGGRTSSLTVTNPQAQADLIQSVYRAADIAPDSVDFIEAHGPGTPLGDPIEISGLKQAFAALYAETGGDAKPDTCGIGSVKTNIGHLEGAAGVAGIVKVLAALRYQQLPGNAGFKSLNRLIDFSQTPFRIQAETTPWSKGDRPRRAAVSSFGFGGSNAHVLLEGFDPVRAEQTVSLSRPVVVPLSAQNEERLTAYATALVDFVEAGEVAEAELPDLAYTYQSGREDMSARVVFVADDQAELINALQAFLTGGSHLGILRAGAPFKNEENTVSAVAGLWLSGESVDWRVLHQPEVSLQRVSAPGYPFARERHWMDESQGGKDTAPVLHPLLHRNVSGLDGLRYQTILKGSEFFWADHHVGDTQILPGVTCLEMARAALGQGAEKTDPLHRLTLEEVVWIRPIQAGAQPVSVFTSLNRDGDDAFDFSIALPGPDTETVPHVQGVLRIQPGDGPQVLALDALRRTAPEKVAVATCYERLQASGVRHGPAFQALSSVQRGNGEVVARLKLPRRLHPTLTTMALHPVMLDAAIQAWVALSDENPKGAAVPFSCRRIVVHGPCEAVMWARVRSTAAARTGAGIQHLDIELCDKDGNVRVSFQDLALRIMTADASRSEPSVRLSEPLPLVLAEPAWQQRPFPQGLQHEARQTTLISAGLGERLEQAVVARLSCPLVHFPDTTSLDEPSVVGAWFTDLHRRLAGLMAERPKAFQRVLVLVPEALSACCSEPLAALLRTAALEHPKIGGAVITVADGLDATQLAQMVDAESHNREGFSQVRYDRDATRWVLKPHPVSLAAGGELSNALTLLADAAYWITGGSGGLGLLFADWLLTQGARHIVLSGRSPAPNAQGREAIAALVGRGAIVHYRECDVADADSVKRSLTWIADEVGSLKGIIHGAGLLQDGYILSQPDTDIADVFAPKVAGSFNLDAATAEIELDFFVLCSSIAASFGNPGQAVYAGANAYLDAFAEQRRRRVQQGERHGRTVSIAWPLWAQGGMSVDASTLEALEQRWGTTPLPTAVGLAAMEQIVTLGEGSGYTVLYGDEPRIHAFLSAYGEVENIAAAAADGTGDYDDGALRKVAVTYLREVLADVLQMESEGIRVNQKLEAYGLDSISIVETTNRLEKRFGPLSKTLFFEYVDLNGIAGHLLEEHKQTLAKILNEEEDGELPPASVERALPTRSASLAKVVQNTGHGDGQESGSDSATLKQDSLHDIAIVGLSLRVAKAADQDAFWKMLSEGIDGFEPYPQARWNHSALLHPERDVLGKTVVRTGAFLDDVDKFDPRYFQISQAEAELMSPEVRLFLESSVEAFEDAGYSREQMQARYGGEVAVIVGSMSNEYDLYGFQNMLVRGAKASGSYTGTVPNMVSYYYGFTGPSYFLDTMCSAASVCVHEAVHMLRAGRCKMALAGGVNLLVHPQKLIATSQEHFTSKTADVIRGYGVGADGTILGEGVGAFVLKPLIDAQQDGDHIYGVITGSGTSNAGIRNGFTVPNPKQQAVAIERALADADIPASAIDYVEGHGSGTALGDPIEVKALTQVFRQDTDQDSDKVQWCPIGTVKGNVAHLLGASGLAGMAKVLMQLRHGELAPSLHAETLNPDIPFDSSPFYVQRKREPWARRFDPDGRALPHRAGVTSIGAGGMNSHIIIEEYRDSPQRPEHVDGAPEILVFSAMNEGRLVQVIERFETFLKTGSGHDLDDVAYTLQVGKNELTCRLALVVADVGEALTRLAAFVAAPSAGDGVYYTRSILDQDPPDSADHLPGWLDERNLHAIAEVWSQGADVTWDQLQRGRVARRVSLPAYPFERVRCWYTDEPDVPSVINPLGSKLKLHPFVGRNVSDLCGVKYTTAIHAGELLDYLCTKDREQMLSPLVAVETAAALAKIAGVSEGISENVSLHNLAVNGAVAWSAVKTLNGHVEPDEGRGVRVVLETVNGSGEVWNWATVELHAETVVPASPIDLQKLRGGATQRLGHGEFYELLAGQGYGFGPYMETVEQAYRLADGGMLCTLRQDAPQQDFFKNNLQLSAPALAAAYQLLAWADPCWSDDFPWSLDEAGFSKADVSDVMVIPDGSGQFSITFIASDGRPASHWTGVARQSRSISAPAAAPAPIPVQAHQAVTRDALAATATDQSSGVIAELRRVAAEILKFAPEDIGLRDLFHDLGFDSITLTRYAHDLSASFNIELSPALFYECEHIQALSVHLIGKHAHLPQTVDNIKPVPPTKARVEAPFKETISGDDVAIIGMAGRFPGCDDIETFIDNLLDGRDLIGDLPLARYGDAYRQRVEASPVVKRGGFLTDIDRFDAAYFKISPVEAERLDPQQRLMLETVRHALDHAGYRADELPSQTGVYVGVSALDYADLLRAEGISRDGYVATGNSLAMVANRISHVLNLHGPSLALDTACSSSLVALLRAVDAVRSGTVDAAVVGGVNLCLSMDGFEGPHDAGMLSPEGRCKSFSATADGYVRGEGASALLVKRLSDAERDGDRIFGVVRGGAENHGGHAGSLTAPSVKAQAGLIQHAMRGIDPHSISYIEAHGTGTNLGDPVEVNGLKRAYAAMLGDQDTSEPFIGLGTVKSNIGHLEAAAGLAGVIKVLMAMERQMVPPTLHCGEINPHIELGGSPFRLVRDRESWPHRQTERGIDQPRRAAVSSFGFGGANAHVVLEAYSAKVPPRRNPLPPYAFASTRFWVPRQRDEDVRPSDGKTGTVTLVPLWEASPLLDGHGAPFDRRIVVGCEIAVAAGHGAELYPIELNSGDMAQRYAALGTHILNVLRDRLSTFNGGTVRVQLVVPVSDERALYAGLGAMLDSAHEENPAISAQVVMVPDTLSSDDVAMLLADEARATQKRVRYRFGRREVLRWIEQPASVSGHRWPDGGVTLIAGGMGGLGRHVALDIAETARGARLILTGRSPLNGECQAFVEQLRGLGVHAEYRSVDMTDGGAMTALVQDIVRVHGALNAVVNCAGCLRDAYIFNKSDEDLASVLAPKVAGTLALQQACADVTLDAFVLFSSLAGVLGNAGQVDYAAANGFIDAFAEREGGNVIAINWPLWRDGGMSVDAQIEEGLYRQMGQRPLSTEAGLAALHDALAGGRSRVAVVGGERDRIVDFFADRFLTGHQPTVQDLTASDRPSPDQDRLKEAVAVAMRETFGRIAGLSPDRIGAKTPLETYGIDSLMITRLNAALEKVFGPLPKTLFFQYRTLAEVVAYLTREQEAGCRSWVGLTQSQPLSSPTVSRSPNEPVTSAVSSPPQTGSSTAVEPIAVIGISGRYPGADDLSAFWQALRSGRNMIGEIPEERWPLDGFFHADADEAVEQGMSYAKWGGFLDGFAEFDPLFFKISPRDAAAMDPQERLFLMSAWAACEEAGYSRSRLKAVTGGEVGVFVGVTKTGFALHGPFKGEGGARIRPMTSFAGMANRVSHALDTCGPSLSVDTMCSSSLTAIHEACLYLRSTPDAMALAGGVNLYLHPSTYIDLSASRMLSAEGQCKSFGAGADGFVPGEGVGCVVLKPLSRALADNDRIHAVIRGSAVNHGGHSHGYTVPSPASQREVIRTALSQAGVDAAKISYVEAHGTGTELGDPIEVEGLSQAFSADTPERGFCGLGSVKSNIGHLEAAAGIAGLTKIILQMKHATLAPTLHAKPGNPNIDFSATPFVVQQAAAPWQVDGTRYAGLSSFGAGGTNAHMIVSDWPDAGETMTPEMSGADDGGLQAIVLSADSPEPLREQAQRLLAFLAAGGTDRPASVGSAEQAVALVEKLAALLSVRPEDIDPEESFDALGLEPHHIVALERWLTERSDGSDCPVCSLDRDCTPNRLLAELSPPTPVAGPSDTINLADLAFTLQVGRDGMGWRLGLAVDSLPSLIDGLGHWLREGNADFPGLHVGQGGAQREAVAELFDEDMVDEGIERWWRQGRMEAIVKLWVGSVDVDWDALPRSRPSRTLSLPTYPFMRHRFWLPTGQARDPLAAVTAQLAKPDGSSSLQESNQTLERHLASVLNAVLAQQADGVIAPGLKRWHEAVFALLKAYGAPRKNVDEAWADWQAYGGLGENRAQFLLATTALRALPEILAGRVQATDVLFPDGSLKLVEAVYKDNPVASRFSQTLAQAVKGYVHARSQSEPGIKVRILEIGAGTGGTSEPVFAALQGDADAIGEYCYSDVSRSFLIHAQRHYTGQIPNLTTALFDVERPLTEQSVQKGSYDLVIAANVLHATADIERTLATVRETLAPGGLLLLNETSQATLFTHVTFGLLKGWWRFTDAQRRIPGTPSLTVGHWQQAVEAVGLEWVAGTSAAEAALGQQVLAARRPGTHLGNQMADRPSSPVLPLQEVAVDQPLHTSEAHKGQGLRARLLEQLAGILNMPASAIDVERAFADFGLDSILGAEWVHRLRRELAIELDQTRMFDFANVRQLEVFLCETYPEAVAALSQAEPTAVPSREALAAATIPTPSISSAAAKKADGEREPIAIVGMSGRFAGSETVADLWSHLMAGTDLVQPVSRFDLSPFYTEDELSTLGRHGSFIDGVDLFDPVFFGISGVEATYMDPQQRLFLQEAYKTLEHAGHGGEDMVGRRCGVFVGCSHGDYQNLFSGKPPGQAFWGNTSSLIPARIAYWLDLKGPAIAVDTACSSSLVAVHLACQSLWSGESEMALAGGVFVQSGSRFFLSANQAQMLSPSGRCASFGAGADGIVPGEAVAAVLLRPLSEALADGDTVHGVIIGSGTNQDGASNGITAPSARSQEQLIHQVHDTFGIDPASIGMIEAHGTGTPLGDPIEYAALNRVFQSETRSGPACFLGSIKSNIGHATTASGISGLIKVLLSLHHRQVPPTLHFAGGNPAIPFAEDLFCINTEPMSWDAPKGERRRAGINSFGFSGTNAHLVVEEAPEPVATMTQSGPFLFVLSARSSDPLRQQAQQLLDHLEAHPDVGGEDLSFTLLMGRRHFHHRLAVVDNDVAALADRLRAWLADESDGDVEVREIEAQDHREDVEKSQTGTMLLNRLATNERGDQKAREQDLQALAGLYLAGIGLSFEQLFSTGCRRLPLPTYPFARNRYWVEASHVVPIVAEAKVSSGKIRLRDPRAEDGPRVPLTLPRISLAPLGGMQTENAAVPPTLRRLPDGPDGVCILELLEPFSHRSGRDLRQALADGEADNACRAVLIFGSTGWQGGEANCIDAQITRAAWACRLPVVAALETSATGPGVALALMADFVVLAEDAVVGVGVNGGGGKPDADALEIYSRRLGRARAEDVFGSGKPIKVSELKAQHSGVQFAAAGRVYEAALDMARQLAQAPREAAELLKRHMRHELSVFTFDDGGDTKAFAAPDKLRTDWPSVDTAQRIQLDTSVMTLDLFDDGVVVLQMVEKTGHNTFTPAFMDGIDEAFAAIAAEPQAKVVVLTGYDGYFACGGTADGLKQLQAGATRFTDRKIYSLPLACELPVIAAMQGHGIGAGWSLGMFCDQALFAAEGVYHSNYMWYGFTPGAGATLIFPYRLGDDLGREALFTAREYRGNDLAGRGPGVTVLPAVEVLPRALAMAHSLALQTRAQLLSSKAEAVKPVASRLDDVLGRELAMHAKTFVGNERVRTRIGEKFGGEQPKPSPQQTPSPGIEIDVRGQLIATLAEDLMIDPVEIRDEAGFLDLGLDSILAVTWIRRLNGVFGTALPATVIYAHPTVGALVSHVADQLPGAGNVERPVAPVACVSMPEPVAVEPPPPHADVRDQLIATLAEDLMIDPVEIRDDAGFLDLGLDSILAVTWIRRLNTVFGTALPATVIYAHPTVGALISHVAELLPDAEQTPTVERSVPIAKTVSPAVEEAPKVTVSNEHSISGAVAIIGASGAFPKANDLEAFWQNIRDGRDCIEEVPADRWDVERFYHPDPNHPDTTYCKWMGRIEQADCFDPQFFNITPREAELMDPQQRLFLQHAWHAVEDAAYDPFALSGGHCGVYMASGPSGYADLSDEQNAYTLSGNSGSILAARISYFLDLHGPSLSIDTACSSSLVAIAEACDALLADRCDMALAGGVSLLIGPKMFIDTSKVSMLSKSGRCYTFDQRADGFVPGEGVGVVVLKRLDAAQRDGDPIRAVIRGWGVNQDGRTNGITAPNPRAQTDLMRDIYRRFDIDPASIDLVECHGTGTPLGDPIEIEGLTDAFANSQQRTSDCVLGSVKSNVGHLLAAAGVAGALKAVLALEEGQQPPAVHFNQCNENINLEETPFTVNTSLQNWPQPDKGQRRAAVSAFGFSGTNAHLVLEAVGKAPDAASSTGPWLFTLSARTADQLQAYAVRMERFVAERADLDLAGLAHTLQTGRSDFSQRLAFVFENRPGLLKALASVTAGRRDGNVHLSQPDAATPSVQDADEDMDLLTAKWLGSGQRDKLDKLAALWVKGIAVNWSHAQPATRLRIPGYPFAEERYWLTPSLPKQEQRDLRNDQRPLVLNGEKKQGLLARQSFEVPKNSASLGGDGNGGDRQLTGLFLPEMARAAVERLSGQPVRGLAHLMWGAPIRLNGKGRSLDILISSDAEGLLYRVASDGDEVSPYHLGEVLSAAEVEKSFRPDDLALDRLGIGETIEHDFAIPSGSSLYVMDVRQDSAELSVRIRRTDGNGGSGKAGLFDADYLEVARLLTDFWQFKGRKAKNENTALAPLAIKSLVAYGPLADVDWLRIWNRADVDEQQSTVVAFYGADGTVRLVLDDIRLVQPDRCDTIHLNTEYTQ